MNTSMRRVLQGLAFAALAAALHGCDSGASIGGTVAGLHAGASVTLENNNSDKVTLSADQGFTFPTTLHDGAGYTVSVLSQPAGESCAVGNGSGTIDSHSDSVTIVVVTCAPT